MSQREWNAHRIALERVAAADIDDRRRKRPASRGCKRLDGTGCQGVHDDPFAAGDAKTGGTQTWTRIVDAAGRLLAAPF
jgi:hypothetical protein